MNPTRLSASAFYLFFILENGIDCSCKFMRYKSISYEVFARRVFNVFMAEIRKYEVGAYNNIP